MPLFLRRTDDADGVVRGAVFEVRRDGVELQ